MSRGDDAGGNDEAGGQAIHDEIIEIMEALRDRYGDREPTEDEIREFLRERALADGRTPEEVEQLLRSL